MGLLKQITNSWHDSYTGKLIHILCWLKLFDYVYNIYKNGKGDGSEKVPAITRIKLRGYLFINTSASVINEAWSFGSCFQTIMFLTNIPAINSCPKIPAITNIKLHDYLFINTSTSLINEARSFGSCFQSEFHCE